MVARSFFFVHRRPNILIMSASNFPNLNIDDYKDMKRLPSVRRRISSNPFETHVLCVASRRKYEQRNAMIMFSYSYFTCKTILFLDLQKADTKVLYTFSKMYQPQSNKSNNRLCKHLMTIGSQKDFLTSRIMLHYLR